MELTLKMLIGLLFLTSLAFAQFKDSLYVEFSGDTVKIWNSATLNCCSHINFETEVNGNKIKLIEVDTSDSWCRCMCNFNLCASLTGLVPGNYDVKVYRKYLHYNPYDSLMYVGSVEFDLPSNQEQPFLSGSYQSTCLGNESYTNSENNEVQKGNDSIFVEFSGDTVIIWNNDVFTNCCSLFKIETEISENTIKLTETDTTLQLCDCLCTFNLSGSISKLIAGHYKVEIYRYFEKIEPDTIYFIGSVEFDYPGIKQSQVMVKSYQSKCIHEVQNEVIIYSNSFESEKDTAGWQGYGSIEFRSDTPPGGDEQSLYISGGCIVPHAYFILPPFETDAYLILRCWGKNLQIGGLALLRTADDPYNEINFTINDTIWTYYESSDTLFCQAGKSLQLTLISGGIVPSSMLVDNIEIVRIINQPLTDVKRENIEISNYNLYQNYPNPFNPVTKIKYTIPTVERSKASLTQLIIYDILGNKVVTLVNKVQSPGEYEVEFDGSELSSGIYFYVLNTGGKILTRKMCLIK